MIRAVSSGFAPKRDYLDFDGYTFTNFTEDHGLPHRNVTDFLETSRGEIWLGTNAGLVCFDPKGVSTRRVINTGETFIPPPMFMVVTPDGEARNGFFQ